MVNGHLAQILFIKKWIDSVGEGIQTQQYGRNLFKISLSVVEVLRETSVAVSPVESTSVVSASSLAFFIASIFLYNGRAIYKTERWAFGFTGILLHAKNYFWKWRKWLRVLDCRVNPACSWLINQSRFKTTHFTALLHYYEINPFFVQRRNPCYSTFYRRL